MSDVLLASEIDFNYDPFLEGRKDLDPTRFAYKLATPGNYGLDVVLGDDLGINESRMSCWINFADGNSRDGVGDVTEVAGIDCDRHRKNPIVLFDHGKKCELPIALAEDPDSKTYTVHLDPVGRTGKAECFFYQGKSGEGLEKNHAQYCYDIFDMLAKKFIRGGSFAYQIKRAERLQPDYTQGTPPGLHLLATRLLELGPTVIPAHQDTVMKMLNMPGRSELFYKSLQPYVRPRAEMVVSGFEKAYNVNQISGPTPFKDNPQAENTIWKHRDDRSARLVAPAKWERNVEMDSQTLRDSLKHEHRDEKAYYVNQIKPETESQTYPEVVKAQHRTGAEFRHPTRGKLARAERGLREAEFRYSRNVHKQRGLDMQLGTEAVSQKAYKPIKGSRTIGPYRNKVAERTALQRRGERAKEYWKGRKEEADAGRSTNLPPKREYTSRGEEDTAHVLKTEGSISSAVEKYGETHHPKKPTDPKVRQSRAARRFKVAPVGSKAPSEARSSGQGPKTKIDYPTGAGGKRPEHPKPTFQQSQAYRRAGLTSTGGIREDTTKRRGDKHLGFSTEIEDRSDYIKSVRAKYSKRLIDGEKGRVTYSESGWEGPPPEHRPQQLPQTSAGPAPKNRIPLPAIPHKTVSAKPVKHPFKGKVITTGFLKDWRKDPPPRRKGMEPLHSEQDDYQSLEQGDAPNSSLTKQTEKENEMLEQFPAEIDRGQKAYIKSIRNKYSKGLRSDIRKVGRKIGEGARKLGHGYLNAIDKYVATPAEKVGRYITDTDKPAPVKHPIATTQGTGDTRLERHLPKAKIHQGKLPGTPGTRQTSTTYYHPPGSRIRTHKHKGMQLPTEEKSQPSDKIKPGKACQIMRDGTAQGHKLTEKQRGLFGAACGKRDEKAINPPKLARNRAAQQENRVLQDMAFDEAETIPGASTSQVRRGWGPMVSKRNIKLGAAMEHGARTVDKKGLEDATTNPETQERHELINEGNAVGVEIEQPSIKDIRSKYKRDKGKARCLKKSVPGSFMVHVESKYLEAMKSAAGKAGIKCECGDAHEGNHKVRLTGLDDAVHKLAGKYGKPGTIGKKFLEAGEKAYDPDAGREGRRITSKTKPKGSGWKLESTGPNVWTKPKPPTKPKEGRKGLEFNIKIQCPNPEYVIQKAQLFGIGAWEDDGGCILSGIDEVEIGRFLRQYHIMTDDQISNLFGGQLAGHKSYEETPDDKFDSRDINKQAVREHKRGHKLDQYVESDKTNAAREDVANAASHLRKKVGKKAMEIHVKDSSDNEEKKAKEPSVSQDETPADQAEYTETPGESYPEDSYEDGYEDEGYGDEGYEEDYEEEGPQEKLGAQIYRELHAEMEEFVAKYDEILPLVEHEGVSQRLMSKLENTVAELEELEAEFEANYPEYGGLGDKDMMEGGMAPEHEEEGASSEGLPEPDPDEVVEGMSKHPDDEETEEETEGEQPLKAKKKSLPQTQRPLQKGFSLLDYELKSVYDATSFLNKLGETKSLDEDTKFDSYFHGKSLLSIQTRIDGFAKGSLLPKPHGHAAEGEDQEVDVNKPSGPSHYNPGKEPMQQFGSKGSILDHYQDTGDAGDALAQDKDVDSHINEPDSPNSIDKPGEDEDVMAYGHDGEWPHKGSLLPAPHGDATEGEDDEVNVNHPSSNPQAKPGADKDHQWFGKPGEWPHKELAPQGQYYKAIVEAGQYLKSLSQCKAYGDALREQAKVLAKNLDPIAEQIQAVQVSQPSGWKADIGAEKAQPFGKPAEWPHKKLTGYLTKMDDTKAKLDALVNMVKTR